MLVGIGGDEAAVGQDHVHLEQIVDGEAIAARQVAQPAAEGDPADAGGGDDAVRQRQPEGIGGVVEVAQFRPALDAGGAGRRIDADAIHQAQVEDHPVVAGAQARAVVPAAADGEEQAPLAGEVDGGDHVGNVGGADDERGVAVDHPVVDLARLVVARVARADEFAARAGRERGHRRLIERLS